MAGKDDTTTHPPAAADDDNDFVVESASSAGAMDALPDDTTLATIAATQTPPIQPSPATDDIDENEDDEVVGGERRATGEESASGATRDESGRFAKGGKKTLSERVKTLKGEVDTQTFQLRQTQREIDAAQTRLAGLRREEAEAARTRSGAPATAGAPGAGASGVGKAEEKPAAKAMPAPPKYRDFATDEEYEAAHATFLTALTEWQSARELALKNEIVSGVDTRLQSKADEDAAAESAREFQGRMREEAAKHADWQEKAAGLQALRSPWYTEERHAHLGTTTPFLSDLVRHHDEGAQFLRFLMDDIGRATRLAALFPSRGMRDALVAAPSLATLFEHFATDEGTKAFDEIKAMHPLRASAALGALSARLTASSGSVTRPAPITKAEPPARPPVGSGTRTSGAQPPANFEDWMAAEDAREERARRERAGLSVSA